MMKSKGLHLNSENQKGKSISTDSSEIGSIYRNIEFLKSIEMSSVLGKPAYSKTIAQITMQLISTFCFHYKDSTIPLLSKLFQAS